jgi:hypothetical protein
MNDHSVFEMHDFNTPVSLGIADDTSTQVLDSTTSCRAEGRILQRKEIPAAVEQTNEELISKLSAVAQHEPYARDLVREL